MWKSTGSDIKVHIGTIHILPYIIFTQSSDTTKVIIGRRDEHDKTGLFSCNCAYNKEDSCCKDNIHVGGKNAKVTDETCCESFREERMA